MVYCLMIAHLSPTRTRFHFRSGRLCNYFYYFYCSRPSFYQRQVRFYFNYACRNSRFCTTVTELLLPLAAGCPDHQTTTLELSASPNDRTHTVGREENFTLELTCTLYNCIGNISWSIPPELQNKTEITNPSLWKSILTVSSLSAAESGEMPHKITCRYMNLEKTYLLNITGELHTLKS